MKRTITMYSFLSILFLLKSALAETGALRGRGSSKKRFLLNCKALCANEKKASLKQCKKKDKACNKAVQQDSRDCRKGCSTMTTSCPVPEGAICTKEKVPVECGGMNCWYANGCLACESGFKGAHDCKPSSKPSPSP